MVMIGALRIPVCGVSEPIRSVMCHPGGRSPGGGVVTRDTGGGSGRIHSHTCSGVPEDCDYLLGRRITP